MLNSRNSNLDFARIICSYGVIVAHISVQTSTALNFQLFFKNFHVPFFYLLSIIFFYRKLELKTQDVISKLALRLLVPFFAWTLVYGFLLYLNGSLELITWRDWIKAIFYGNTAVHLYFVPQLFMLQMLLLFGFKTFKTFSFKYVPVLVLCITYFVIGQVYEFFGATSYQNIVFYLFFGFLLKDRILNEGNKLLLVIGLLIALGIVYATYYIDYNGFINLPWGGLSLILIFSNLKEVGSNKSQYISRLALYSFGIYLIHVIFIEGFEFAANTFNLSLEADLAYIILFSVAVFIISYYSVKVLSKSAFLSKLFFGNV